MILGEKYGKRRSIQSEDFFFFRERHDFGRKIRKKEIVSKLRPFFLEIIMILMQQKGETEQLCHICPKSGAVFPFLKIIYQITLKKCTFKKSFKNKV